METEAKESTPDASGYSDGYNADGVKDHAELVRAELAKNGEAGEWEVVVADDTVLLLDYDIKSEPEYGPPSQFQRMIGRLFTNFKSWKEYQSRSGNVHIVVQLGKPLPVLERVAWQAILGSDPKREALHMVSLAKGSLNPIVLVMRKDRDKDGR